LDGQLWNVIEFQHVKPGKGGAFVRTKMRSVLSGKVVEKTFNAGVKVEVASVEKRNMQYLYRDGEDFMFMDSTNYDQISVSKQTVGEAVDYLLENAGVVVAMHEGNPLFIEMPASVELVITYTEPGLQGDRSSGGTKPATVETGITIQVPLFIKQDEKVLVDTRTGAYLGRAN
jgi:elongation factor P